MGELTCAIEVQSINLPEEVSAVLNILCSPNLHISIGSARGLEPCFFKHSLFEPKASPELHRTTEEVCVVGVQLCAFNVVVCGVKGALFGKHPRHLVMNPKQAIG